MSELLSLPVYLKLKGAVCALVGEGEVAARKRYWLARAGADIHEFPASATADEIVACQPALIIVADSENAASISAAANAQLIPVNVVDQPALCSFIFPSIIERGALTVAVTSNGRLPVLARLIRARIESLLPVTLAQTIEQLAALRPDIAKRLINPIKRRLFWDRLFEREFIAPGQNTYTPSQIDALIASLEEESVGEIAVVGAGPNDISQLTLAALSALQQADVVVVQDDVAADIIALARRDAVIWPAIELTNLPKMAVLGKRCVYLVTGDPLSHPHMAQQLALWHAEKVSYRVVAGIIDQTGMNFYAERF